MTKTLTRDVLTSILRTLRLRVRLMSRGDYCGQWALDSGERNKATFHLVGRGELWLHCSSRPEPVLLSLCGRLSWEATGSVPQPGPPSGRLLVVAGATP